MTSPSAISAALRPARCGHRSASALAALLAPLALAVVGSAASVASPFTIDHELRFAAPTDKARMALRQTPAAREIVSGEFAITAEDLDGDGKRELILLARSPSMCLDGRCTVLVIQRTPNGVETLLLQRVPGQLALTKEKMNGYRALAALDANGGIATGDRRDGALAGKPLVYPMQIGAASSAVGAPDKGMAEMRPPPPGPAPAAPVRKSGPVNLEDIAVTLALPAGDNDAKIDWKAMDKLAGIRMQGKDTKSTERYSYRTSTLTLEALGKTDITWTGGYDNVVAAIVDTAVKIPPVQYTSVLKRQFPTSRLTQLRGGCKGNEFEKDAAIYQVGLAQRQPLYLHVTSHPLDRSGHTTIVVSQENSPRWGC